MGIFTKPVTKAAISEPPKVQAALGFGGTYSKDAIGAFYQYTEGTARAEAMTLQAAVWVVMISACLGVVLEGPMGAIPFWIMLGLAHHAATAPLPADSVSV